MMDIRKYLAPILIGGLWGAASLESFFINIWLNWEPGWLVKLITLPGYLAHFIKWYTIPLPEWITGVLELFLPVAIGSLIAAGLHYGLTRNER